MTETGVRVVSGGKSFFTKLEKRNCFMYFCKKVSAIKG